jgi:hypothetical protein
MSGKELKINLKLYFIFREGRAGEEHEMEKNAYRGQA